MDFEKIVKKFILKQGIGAVVENYEIHGNKCDIFLRGGFSKSLEIVDNLLLCDERPYCTLKELGGC